MRQLSSEETVVLRLLSLHADYGVNPGGLGAALMEKGVFTARKKPAKNYKAQGLALMIAPLLATMRERGLIRNTGHFARAVVITPIGKRALESRGEA